MTSDSAPLERPMGAASWRVALAAGGVYFLAAFGVGFLLGIVRTLWLAPEVGERWAELLEMPVMLAVIYVAARWIGRRFDLASRGPGVRLGVGLVALLLLVLGEVLIVLELRGLSLPDYIAGRDPVSGTAYLVSLLLFAAMPLLATPK